jgi:TRAP-type mannitol/chloroaromatic compound transport system substrate-binding protein
MSKSNATFAIVSALSLAVAAVLPLTGTSAGAAEVEGPKLHWNVSTWGKKRAFTAGIEKVAEIVNEKTGGNWVIQIHYGEALSKAKENLDGIKLGAFEVAMFCNFYHPGKNPAFMVLTMPFLPLKDWETSLAVRKALFATPAFKADMDQWNAMTYISTLLPQYEFLGKGEPPLKLADWKGKRVRAGGGIGSAMEVLGAVPTSLPATDVYTGIERGTLDAASFPYTYSHAAYKIDEIADWYTSNMAPGTTECPVVINKTAYDKLPDQYKKLLEDAKDEAYDAQIQAYIDIDKVNLPKFESEMQKIVYTDEQLEEFQKVAGKPVWDQWVAENKDKFDAQGLIDLALTTAKEVKAKQAKSN